MLTFPARGRIIDPSGWIILAETIHKKVPRCPNQFQFIQIYKSKMSQYGISQYWDFFYGIIIKTKIIQIYSINLNLWFSADKIWSKAAIISVPYLRDIVLTEVLGFGGGGRWDELHSFVEWSNSKQWGTSVSCFSMYLMLNDSQSRYCLCRVYAIQCYIYILYTCCT